MAYNRDNSIRYDSSFYNTPNSPYRMQLLRRFAPGLHRARATTTLAQTFDHVYVLNLARRPDRRRRVLERCAKHELRPGRFLTVFEATDGEAAPHRQRWEAYAQRVDDAALHPLEVRYGRRLLRSPGAWGYVQTMKRVVADAAKRGYRRILTLDDDVRFSRDFADDFRLSVSTIPTDWRVLYLGASQHVAHDRTIDTAIDVPWYRPDSTDGSFALGLHCAVFDEVRQAPDTHCFDSCTLRDICARHPAYVCFPFLAIADVAESDIQEGRDMSRTAASLRWGADVDTRYPT